MKSLADSEFNRLVREFPALQSRVGEGIDFVNFDCEVVESCCGSSYVIPFVSETECLVTMRENRRWVLPGGTLEPGEGWLQAAHREIMEETGAALSNVKPIGMYHCASKEPQPRLPNFPHPIHVRVVSCADADQIYHVQPQAAGILRRFDHHPAGGIAPGLRPARTPDRSIDTRLKRLLLNTLRA